MSTISDTLFPPSPKKGREIIIYNFFPRLNSLGILFNDHHQRIFPESEKTRFLLTRIERKKTEETEERVTMEQKPFEHLTCNLDVGLENHFNASQLIVSNLINGLCVRANREQQQQNPGEKNPNGTIKNFEKLFIVMYFIEATGKCKIILIINVLRLILTALRLSRQPKWFFNSIWISEQWVLMTFFWWCVYGRSNFASSCTHLIQRDSDANARRDEKERYQR